MNDGSRKKPIKNVLIMSMNIVAYDFVFNPNKNPLNIEINYGFAKEVYNACSGYWDKDLNWHEGKFNQVEWILEEITREH
jgi:hypothetical protein